MIRNIPQPVDSSKPPQVDAHTCEISKDPSNISGLLTATWAVSLAGCSPMKKPANPYNVRGRVDIPHENGLLIGSYDTY